MKLLFVLPFMFVSLCVEANGLCQREPRVDPEYPAGLEGDYEIIGQSPDTGSAYTGKLNIEIDKNGKAYTFTRIVEGFEIKGEAWLSLCTTGKYPVIKFRYTKVKPALKGSCYTRFNSDNYNIVSCYVYIDAKKQIFKGYESMFPVMPEP